MMSHRVLHYDTAVHLFVYGSLMRGHGPLADLLWSQAEFMGEGSILATLYDLGRHPGIVDGPGQVHGEVARLLTPNTTLTQLDEYEGLDYERLWRRVLLRDGSTFEAMAYFYRGDLDKASTIDSGRWLEF